MLDAMVAWKDFHNREAKRLKERIDAAVPRNVTQEITDLTAGWDAASNALIHASCGRPWPSTRMPITQSCGRIASERM